MRDWLFVQSALFYLQRVLDWCFTTLQTKISVQLFSNQILDFKLVLYWANGLFFVQTTKINLNVKFVSAQTCDWTSWLEFELDLTILKFVLEEVTMMRFGQNIDDDFDGS